LYQNVFLMSTVFKLFFKINLKTFFICKSKAKVPPKK
jgi:hypothetical protein